MSEGTNKENIYFAAITEITNTIHECSRITEVIEGKTYMIRNTNRPTSPEASDDQAEAPLDLPTDLAKALSNVQEYAEELRQRLSSLEDDIAT